VALENRGVLAAVSVELLPLATAVPLPMVLLLLMVCCMVLLLASGPGLPVAF
jgi:hypothetical protein